MTKSTLTITICGDQGAEAVAESLAPLLLPYLSNLVVSAKLASPRIQRRLTGRNAGERNVALDIEVDGEPPSSFDETASKLEKFLKLAATHAGIQATFEVFHIEKLPEPARVGAPHESS